MIAQRRMLSSELDCNPSKSRSSVHHPWGGGGGKLRVQKMR